MNAENPTDVIEAVALAIGKHRHGSQEAWDEDRRLARALHDAGLLADPADRDEEAIGRAVEIIARMSWEGPEQEWPLWRDATEDDRQRIREKVQPIAETLADEGLLTNPDEFVSSWAAGKERARAERAEAEVNHWKSRAERAEAKLAQTEMALSDAMSAEVAELRATVDRVRALVDEWRSHYELPPIHRPPLMHWDQVADILRAALGRR